MRFHSVAIVLVLSALCLLQGYVVASTCSETQVVVQQKVMKTHQRVLAQCEKALSISSANGGDFTTVIDRGFLDTTKSERVCAVSACVKVLIAAMEDLPDCCSQTSTSNAYINLPRLADDILHQCDLRDAKLLAAELEREIAELPDLKVQIKAKPSPPTTDATGASSSSSSSDALEHNSNSSDGDDDDDDESVDIIIDVKKRELMKAGESITDRDRDSQKDAHGADNASGMSPMSHPSMSVLLLGLVFAMSSI